MKAMSAVSRRVSDKVSSFRDGARCVNQRIKQVAFPTVIVDLPSVMNSLRDAYWPIVRCCFTRVSLHT